MFIYTRYKGVRFFSLMIVLFPLVACNQTKPESSDSAGQKGFSVRSLAKTDLNQVMEVYTHEIRAQLRLLMVKLYKRNPRELKKSPYPTAEENIQRIFSRTSNWHFRELNGINGAEAIELTFDDDYQGDRVFTFMVGLTSMLMASYNYKTEFFVFSQVDPQALYNSARNIELAAWKLDINRDKNGEPFLYSYSLPGEPVNRSYAALFGKLTILQDTMSEIIAEKTNRTITKVIQRMATAVFLPIP